MVDNCRSRDTDDCCALPPHVLSKQPAGTAPAAACGTAEDSCCPKGVPVFDGVNPRHKRVLWTVIA